MKSGSVCPFVFVLVTFFIVVLSAPVLCTTYECLNQLANFYSSACRDFYYGYVESVDQFGVWEREAMLKVWETYCQCWNTIWENAKIILLSQEVVGHYTEKCEKIAWAS